LLRSIPLLGMTKAEPLNVIPGMVPSALQWPLGCRFAARCSYASDHCHREPPEMFATGSGYAACWLRSDTVERSQPGATADA
jgi:oligopeptide/dipeptide ABC transporter ATP-binding protein